ncbi:MAG TPA: ribbon-helix-helix protein, CopG family [Candidatus Polarisedimenticolaceae bacterium]|nr:ribbon-helix-helix protein, CopG family [Candidatus Polarisedimenticolaceae bacterium]
MVRTVISLEQKDKRWLDKTAASEGVPMTELIRRAVRLLRDQTRRERPQLDDLLDATSGSWKLVDGLSYQRKMRREW